VTGTAGFFKKARKAVRPERACGRTLLGAEYDFMGIAVEKISVSASSSLELLFVAL
jgi:hypothetical protein